MGNNDEKTYFLRLDSDLFQQQVPVAASYARMVLVDRNCG